MIETTPWIEEAGEIYADTLQALSAPDKADRINAQCHLELSRQELRAAIAAATVLNRCYAMEAASC